MSTNTKKRIVNLRQAIVILVVGGIAAFALFSRYANLAEAALLPAVFELPDGKVTQEYRLEIAARPELRTKGLMFRKELRANHGMLFVFPESSDHGIWMKDTYVSLDVVYIDDSLKVVGVIENLPPLSEKSNQVGIPNKFIVELPAGAARRAGITAGSRIRFKGPVPAGV